MDHNIMNNWKNIIVKAGDRLKTVGAGHGEEYLVAENLPGITVIHLDPAGYGACMTRTHNNDPVRCEDLFKNYSNRPFEVEVRRQGLRIDEFTDVVLKTGRRFTIGSAEFYIVLTDRDPVVVQTVGSKDDHIIIKQLNKAGNNFSSLSELFAGLDDYLRSTIRILE